MSARATSESARTAALLLGIPSPDMAGLAIRAGCDTVILDCEHGFPPESIPAMWLATKAHGGKCLVRISREAVAVAAPLADIGVDGIMLSGAQQVADLTNLVQFVSFPPEGARSINPFVPAADSPGDIAHLRTSAHRLEVWAMAENLAFLEDLRSVASAASTPMSWTGITIGPYDLSAALGCSADPDDPVLLDAVRDFVSAARSLSLECSMFVRDIPTLARWRQLGVAPDSVVIGYDRDVWFGECRSRVSAVRLGAGLPDTESESA